MSWSSGKDVFKASTWYPWPSSISLPDWLTFSSKRIFMSWVSNGFSGFGWPPVWVLDSRPGPKLDGGEWNAVTGDTLRLWETVLSLEWVGTSIFLVEADIFEKIFWAARGIVNQWKTFLKTSHVWLRFRNSLFFSRHVWVVGRVIWRG